MGDTTAGEVDDLLNLESGLTPWEMDFLDSVRSQMEQGRTLSARQASVIHRIWDRLCG